MNLPDLDTLCEMLNGTLYGQDHGGFSSMDIDSRRLQADSLFVAFAGEQTDGHLFLKAAKEKGAKAALIENSEFANDEILPCVLVSSCQEAMLEIASWQRKQRSHPVLAITGTNGKTSTKDFIYQLFSQKMSCVKTIGNFNNQLGLPLSLVNTCLLYTSPSPRD